MVKLSDRILNESEEYEFGLCHNCGSDNLGASSSGLFCRNCGFNVVNEDPHFFKLITDINPEELHMMHYLEERGVYFDDRYYSHSIIPQYYLRNPTRKFYKRVKWNKRFKNQGYKEWRENVIKKHKGKCLKCSERATHCHHIKNYKQHPELRHDPKNGVLFCKECHEDFHTIFGVINNNRSQITKFLKMGVGDTND